MMYKNLHIIFRNVVPALGSSMCGLMKEFLRRSGALGLDTFGCVNFKEGMAMMKFLFKVGTVALVSVSLFLLSGCGGSAGKNVGTSAVSSGSGTSGSGSSGSGSSGSGSGSVTAATAAAQKAAPPAKVSIVSAKK
jgi:hypothetical protein